MSTAPELSRIGRRRAGALKEGSDAYRRKREELFRAAAAVFKEKGYEAATLNDIATRVNTDRASLYYYVSGKEELLREAVRGVLDDNVREAERILRSDLAPPVKLEMLVRQVMRSYEENYPQMYVYIQEDMSKVADESTPWARQMVKQTRRFEDIAEAVIEEGVRGGAFRADVPVPLVAFALFGMVNWTHRWFRPGRGVTSDEAASAFSRLLLEGLATPLVPPPDSTERDGAAP